MTLSVLTYTRKPKTGEIEFDACQNESESLAGPERWRTEVWSAEELKKVGAKYLPQLEKADLYVEHDELNEFEEECNHLIAKIAVWANDDDGIKHRLINMKHAINKAKANKGGVFVG